jgi:hypothetical protein
VVFWQLFKVNTEPNQELFKVNTDLNQQLFKVKEESSISAFCGAWIGNNQTPCLVDQ